MKKSGKKLWPWYAVAGMDLLALGIALCVFALFHHVLPTIGGEKIEHIVSVDNTPEASPNGVDATDEPGSSEEPGTSPTATPVPEIGDFSATFPDYDTGVGALKSYQSDNIRIAITMHQENDVTYYLADVYVRQIKYFITAFANGVYGRGQRQNTVEMANDSGVIFAVNGDYYGARNSGIVIRNGDLYRDSISSDVCVLYADGTMQTYDQNSFDLNQVIDDGAYQAWGFGPRLLTDGKAMTEFNSSVQKKNPRCSIGYYAPGHYCFIVVDGRQEGYSEGLSLEELSSLYESMGCKDAFNLDGGQTAMMVFQGELVNKPYNGGRTCSDIVGFKEVD